MNVLAVISPGLKVLFERVGKPEVINRPKFLQFGNTGAVIACNHVGWADNRHVKQRILLLIYSGNYIRTTFAQAVVSITRYNMIDNPCRGCAGINDRILF